MPFNSAYFSGGSLSLPDQCDWREASPSGERVRARRARVQYNGNTTKHDQDEGSLPRQPSACLIRATAQGQPNALSAISTGEIWMGTVQQPRCARSDRSIPPFGHIARPTKKGPASERSPRCHPASASPSFVPLDRSAGDARQRGSSPSPLLFAEPAPASASSAQPSSIRLRRPLLRATMRVAYRVGC